MVLEPRHREGWQRPGVRISIKVIFPAGMSRLSAGIPFGHRDWFITSLGEFESRLGLLLQRAKYTSVSQPAF